MDHTTITPEEREKLIQEDMKATDLSREELERLQYERIWEGDAPNAILVKKGQPCPKNGPGPVPMPQWPSDKAVSKQLGEPQK